MKYFKDEKFLEIIILKSKFSNLNFKKSRVKLHETTFPVNNPILRVFYEIFYIQFYYLKMKLMCFFVEEFQYLGLPKNCKKVTMFRNMQPFVSELGKGVKKIPFKKNKNFF